MANIEAPNVIGIAEPVVIGIDNGATNTRILSRQGDTKLGYVEYPTPRDYIEAITKLGRAASLLTNGRPVDGIGFAIAGEVGSNGQSIVRAGQLGDYGWIGRPFRNDVAQQIDVEEASIVLLNDCVAAAKAQQVANRDAGAADSGFVETISTGFGGAGFHGNTLIPDEPGHEFLRAGAMCGCGSDGCVEAHISGSGIERKFGVAAKVLQHDKWSEVVADAVEAHAKMLERFSSMGFEPATLHLFGSVALKQPYLMLPGIRTGLAERASQLPFVPEVAEATHGDNGGLVGAYEAAFELATS